MGGDKDEIALFLNVADKNKVETPKPIIKGRLVLLSGRHVKWNVNTTNNY
jgi:hypothetical protein